MQNLFKEQNSIKLVLGFFIASLIFLLLFGFSLLFSAKIHAQTVSVPRQDSDSDGILDFYEINVYGTDFQKEDTDSDGYSDSKELEWGFDPLDASPGAKYLLSTFSPFLRSSDAYISRHLTVKGNLTADDIVKIAKELIVYGSADFQKGVTIEGKTNLQGSLQKKGKKPVNIQDSLNVTSKITAKSLKVTNTATTKNLTVSDTATIKTLNVSGKITANSLEVSDGTLTGSLVVNNDIEVGNKITAGEIALDQDRAKVDQAQIVVSTDNVNNTLNIQSGSAICSGSDGQGTVTFLTAFGGSDLPTIIAAPAGYSGATTGDVYAVQVRERTTSSFNYMIFNTRTNLRFDCSTTNTVFMWVAIGVKA